MVEGLSNRPVQSLTGFDPEDYSNTVLVAQSFETGHWLVPSWLNIVAPHKGMDIPTKFACVEC
jgi:hypothetical protein